MSQLTLEQASKLAIEHQAAGRLAEAEAIYRQILKQQPNYPDATHYLGLIAHEKGQADRALDLIRRSITLLPTASHYHNNLGKVLRHAGDLDGAEAAYR